MHVERLSLVIITANNTAQALSAISHIRARFPKVPIICRAHDLEASGRLLAAGATQALPEAIESSLRLGAMALEMIDVPEENVEDLLQSVRRGNYELVTPSDGPEDKT